MADADARVANECARSADCPAHATTPAPASSSATAGTKATALARVRNEGVRVCFKATQTLSPRLAVRGVPAPAPERYAPCNLQVNTVPPTGRSRCVTTVRPRDPA
ncbi:hypothetical protein GCM10009754_23130 [Amycolatopsis minnesotensis]|uniref:Uncharacterized protein n=1 Tax=Amycolatopsis minnesotensis TaxID=337894 RepID=A0ABN2QIV2_9PSEU